MIGNDVIDLKLAASESDWRRKGFLQKIFSADEISLVESSQVPQLTVWLLWSRKETAYKIYHRLGGPRKFNPLAFDAYSGFRHGHIRFGNHLVYCRSTIDDDHISTVGVLNETDFSDLQSIADDEIIKQRGLPFLRDRNLLLPATLSHHGRFTEAYALKGDGLDMYRPGKRAVNGAFLCDFQ